MNSISFQAMNKHFKQKSRMKIEPKILLPKPKKLKKNGFYTQIRYILIIAKYLGFFPIMGLSGGSWKTLQFKWWSSINILSQIVSICSLIQSLICVWFVLKTKNYQRFNSIVFYFRGSLTCFFFIKLAKSWPKLMENIAEVEAFLKNYPLTRVNINRRLRVLGIGMFMIAAIEHICSQTGNYLKAVHCGRNLSGGAIGTYFKIISFPQDFQVLPYSIYIAIIIQILHFLNTFAWNFLDTFIILVSTAFSAKLIQFEEKIAFLKSNEIRSITIWKHIREDYSQLCHVFKNFNAKLSSIIILSFTTNVFFILWQLFASLTVDQTELLQVYYMLSLLLLILRVYLVCIFGAQFYGNSSQITNSLTTIKSAIYNEEIDRFIMEVDTAPLILSGGSFFYIKKSLVLELAGAIVTYELVLLQFSNQMLENSFQNSSLCQP